MDPNGAMPLSWMVFLGVVIAVWGAANTKIFVFSATQTAIMGSWQRGMPG